jgi:hypothetical protein
MNNIKKWITNKLVSPAIPVLKQIVYVLDIVIAKIDSSIKALESLGIKLDGTVLTNIQNTLTAITVVRAAIVKVLEFLGEKFEIQTSSHEVLSKVDLNSEIEKLKNLL